MLWSEARAGPPSWAAPGWSSQCTERAKGAGAAQAPGGLERGALSASHSCLLTAHTQGKADCARLVWQQDGRHRLEDGGFHRDTQGEQCHGDDHTRRAPQRCSSHPWRCQSLSGQGTGAAGAPFALSCSVALTAPQEHWEGVQWHLSEYPWEGIPMCQIWARKKTCDLLYCSENNTAVSFTEYFAVSAAVLHGSAVRGNPVSGTRHETKEEQKALICFL